MTKMPEEKSSRARKLRQIEENPNIYCNNCKDRSAMNLLLTIQAEVRGVADKIPSEIGTIVKSWFYAKRPRELEMRTLIDMLSVAMQALLVEAKGAKHD